MKVCLLCGFHIGKELCLVLSIGEQGYLEGRCKDLEGWFPSNHVQDICVFSKYYHYNSNDAKRFSIVGTSFPKI